MTEVEFKAMAIMIMAGLFAFSLVIYYLIRKHRLEEREQALGGKLNFLIYEKGHPPKEGFIFCSLFRVSHIYLVGEDLGVILNREDVAQIIAEIKKNFTLREGITAHSIRNAIQTYLANNKPIHL